MTRAPAAALARGQSAPDHTARYERLRAYTVERHDPPSRDGLVVLLRQGIAVWMDEWSRLPALPLRPVQAERLPPAAFPDEASAEVVHILTAMTLGHIPEVYA